MKIAYIRVSTLEQNVDRQKEALKKYEIERWYEEKISAKDLNRPQLNQMLDFAREGDMIYVADFSRLARRTEDLLKLVRFMEEKKINLISVKENLDTSTAVGKLMLTMIAAINEFERANLLERQKEGIAIAKKNGAYKGRSKKEIDSNFEEKYELWKNRKITATQFAKEVKMSRATLYKRIKELENIK